MSKSDHTFYSELEILTEDDVEYIQYTVDFTYTPGNKSIYTIQGWIPEDGPEIEILNVSPSKFEDEILDPSSLYPYLIRLAEEERYFE